MSTSRWQWMLMPDSVKDILLPHAGHADVYTSRASLCTNIVTPGLLQQPVCRMHSATLCRLQRVQDCAAILLCDASSRAHVSPLREQLHWLPVHSRIQYKLCMMYSCIPQQGFWLFSRSLPLRWYSTLRSSSRGDFSSREPVFHQRRNHSVWHGIHCHLTSEHSYQEIHLVDT